MKSDKKKEFVSLFNTISKYEGGVIYNRILKNIRENKGISDTYGELLNYASERGVKQADILSDNMELFNEAYEYGRWYEELSEPKKKAVKHREKMRYFKEEKDG